VGIDTLIGGTGNDLYSIDNTKDVIIENAGEGTDTVQSSVTFSLANLPNLENLTLTGTDTINGTGNAVSNTLIGNVANNILDGGAGNDYLNGDGGTDTLIGGTGNDIYVVDSNTDVIIENVGEGTDTVQSSATFSLVDLPNIENLTLTGTAAVNGTGNAANNVLIGNSANNSLDGGDGNDTLNGGEGVDTLIGGDGDDVYIVDSITGVITEKLGEGIDIVQASVSFSLANFPNIENLTLTGTDAIDGIGNGNDNIITGNIANNKLTGGAGNDTLKGDAGVDTLIGGTGNDLYLVDTTTDVITENAGEGTDTIQSSVTFSLAALPNVENLTLTGIDPINGTGNALSNVLTGNNAANTLNGGTGTDTLIGGLGGDTYIVDNTGDVVIEIANAGKDTVLSSVTYTLDVNIENLTLTGTAAINGTGNALANIITGNDANNILDGLAGIDTLLGGAGADTLIVNSITDTIDGGADTDTIQSSVTFSLDHPLVSNVENLVLTGTAVINGTGDASNNVITGNSAANVLNGDTGTDTLIGGAGDDTLIVDSLNDKIDGGADNDTIQSSVTFSLANALVSNVENLTLTGIETINATGNASANVITGNTVNNTINGGGGIDTLVGRAGNDVFIVDTTTDKIDGGADTDTIQSSVTFSLASTLVNSVENLTLTGTDAIDGTGNALANVITGNDANNILDGLAGIDTLLGGAGADTLIVNSITDKIDGGAGADTVQSSVGFSLASTFVSNVENLTLTGTTAINGTGNASANIITGNSNKNILDGGAGVDTLIGGADNDTYIVDSTADVIVENAGEGTDTILSSVTFSLATLPNVENLTLTGTNAINGTGNAADNILKGNDANNTLNGGTGTDTLIGGLGDDTYVINNIVDVVTEITDGGNDSILSNITYTLGANFENLTLTGTDTIDGTGNSSDNVITGNGSNNILNGGAGVDTLVGGAGDDTFIINTTDGKIDGGTGTDKVQSSVTIDLSDALISNVENLTLTGTTAINGKGNTLANVIEGNSAANTLDGGAGIDTLTGGLGNDTYVIDNINDVIIEAPSQGTDTVFSGVDYTLGVDFENLTLSGTASIKGTGNGTNNVLIGNNANNTLNGGEGKDTLTGNGGRDILVGGTGNDILNLGLNDGVSDLVRYNFGDGTDTINEFVKGTDKLAFTNVSFIDVKVSGLDTQLRIGDGIKGNTNFGTGTLLATIAGLTGFTPNELGLGGTSLDSSNTALFSFT
jgi:hypothetical protein